MSDTSPAGSSAPGSARDTPLAGWYHDPAEPNLVRWWDGRDWTGHVQRPPVLPPVLPPVPAAAAAGPAAAPAAGPAVAPAAVLVAEPIGWPAIPTAAAEPSLGGEVHPAEPAEPTGAPTGPPRRSADILSETRAVARRSAPSRRTLAIAAAATVGVLVVAGIGATATGMFSSGDTPAPAGVNAQPVAVAMAPNIAPRVGDCFTAPVKGAAARSFQVGTLAKLPCSARHVLQVYALTSYVGPLPARAADAYLAAIRHCPAPDAFLADHYRWVERFQPAPIVGTSAKAKGRTWMACAVGLSGPTAFESVPGSFKGVISAPGAMARFGLCSPTKPSHTFSVVACRPRAGMWLLADLALGTPGSKFPGAAPAAALARAACARYIAVTAPHVAAVVVAPSVSGWARNDRLAACFLPLDQIPGATTA